MLISFKRIKALVKKEIKDLARNKSILIPCFIPLVIVIIFKQLTGGESLGSLEKLNILNLGLNFNLLMVGALATSMLIAEEKEKNTLRTLMLSSVKPIEFLIGKAIVIGMFSFITNILIYTIVGLNLKHLGHFALWVIVVSIIMIFIGGIIGLVSPNQMSTSVVSAPLVLVFALVPTLANANKYFDYIAKILPNHNLLIILEGIYEGKEYNDFLYNLFFIFLWLILSFICFIITYNKRGLDQ